MGTHARIAIGLVIIGLLGIVGWKVAEPMLAAEKQASVSDVGEKGTIRLGIDAWVGYFPLCSPEMKRRLHREGYSLVCTDDAANYQERFTRLKQNEYEFAVATVDSYLLNGAAHHFPGPVVAVVDESKGGDAIIARKDKVPNLETLKNAEQLRVAFTPNSPSHHLLKAVASHFDVGPFREKSAYLETEGSEAALKALQNGQADIAVLWEPDVSKALQSQDYVRLLGTEVTQELIVDILIASQKTVKDQPEMVLSLLKTYFETLKFYRTNRERLVTDISRRYKINSHTAEELLQGVAWATLTDNAERWYGVDSQQFSEESLVHSISSAANILLDNQDFTHNPLPNEDPYRLINSDFIKTLHQRVGNSGSFTVAGQNSAHTPTFSALSDTQWQQLDEVGSLKTRKITFASGTANLTDEGKQQIDALINDLQHYPLFRVEVRGHTGVRGDADANQVLSQRRADAVRDYMFDRYALDKHRVRSVGFGGTRPLVKKNGESTRAYQYRLPRVEIVLVREVM